MLIEANPGVDKKVRNVRVKYINSSSGSKIEVERPIQRLIVLLAANESHPMVNPELK